MGNFLAIGNLWFHKELFFVYTIDFVVCITKLQNFENPLNQTLVIYAKLYNDKRT